MKILVCGLPGSGKTTLAAELAKQLGAAHLNADKIRDIFFDWDFSDLGRARQAWRMGEMARMAQVGGSLFVIADFVAPQWEHRESFNADFTIFMDTIRPEESRFSDTAALFERPETPDAVIPLQGDVVLQAADLVKAIHAKLENIRQQHRDEPPFSFKKPTGVMIGRFQPFHGGHKKLFEAILAKKGQVIILVRDTFGDASNPFDFGTVQGMIHDALREYKNLYIVQQAPNIEGVYYGREVGYEVERIQLDAATESISGTAIRAKMAE